MRLNLAVKEGYRGEFIAKFIRYGWKAGYRAPLVTVLFGDVRFMPGKEFACDHLWFNDTKGFKALSAQPGDRAATFETIPDEASSSLSRFEAIDDDPDVRVVAQYSEFRSLV